MSINVNPGDVLKVRCTYKGIGIWHYGIVTEDFRVIDHGPEGTQERSWASFSGGGQVFLERHSNPNVSRSEVIRRARQLIGKLSYDSISMNCEHFVNRCRKGRSVSGQVRNGTIIWLCVFILCFVGIISISRRN